ncbi:MAG: hypothetical protein CMN85_10885 [Spongiibacteraceae bacterium]|uniref:hypothetical protein n=1 Tax=uncultured Haliea sp. TaxID=622616 RepID=UPI000C53C1B9|nr:hypothetical protein [Spongiibacteraceae bacterium]|tara:strand:+ start:21637 stop:22071 length:435 start_codon:yes stop_codon:yes gene_type:complete
MTSSKVRMLQGGDAQQVDKGGKFGRIGGATITVGTEAANVINVAIQLEQPNGDALDEFGYVTAYLSDDSGGDGVAGTAPSGTVVIGTDGAIIGEITAKKVLLLQSEADGDIDINITETGADTWYLVVILPSGVKVVSDAITFAA